jgi:hypothetical protein
MWIGLIQLRVGAKWLVAVKKVTNLRVPLKGEEFIDYLRHYQLPKKKPIPRN